ncbi:NADPH:quinone reductase [Actinokineospora alba]|uniref:NADPH:quinone reductase n=1 Tax=Actinokineospora alba TaxID=504798 RepID=A0A1H0GGC1_9PSEU|nr:zinc-binding dehydrogenase [Actinokineospora alba]TDP69879.1 NADPH:quinone reductase-like Zn-dependent oxidoreductase [Actinokineospora alba]SDI06789.1 NADPH:quinone reductase [Actinokineospora alba]SDO05781.1 NADPH:quinone reductase [Actinokineospora alba]
MRAAVITAPGSPDAIEIIDIATPEPGAGEIRVRVAAAGVNPVDLQTRAGAFHDLGWITQPDHVGLGWDVAGTVTAVGPGAGFAVGDRVAALSEGVDRALGTYAEEVVVPAAAAAVVPDGLSLTDAATVPLNALTAAQALDLLGAPEGRTLLVTGAAGGVGGYTVAFAAERGWRVTGLARSTDAEFVTAAGASALITEPTGAYDAVVDAAVLADAAVALTRDGGHYVGVIPPAVPDGAGRVRTEAVMVTADSPTLAKALAATAEGTLPARVHAALPLEQAALAHKAVAAGGTRGRHLLIPN